MSNELREKSKNLYSLMPLEEFKAVLGVDDREDKLARFCLVTATFTIEQYCKRRFLRKTIHQVFREWRDLILFLREYPVREILAVSVLENGEILEPELYSIEQLDDIENIPCQLILSPALKRMREITALKIIYKAGYAFGKAPPDLAAACMELASWNMNRYRGRRIGMTANIKGNGKEGERFETTMPENVKAMIEPYKRITI